MEIFKTEQRPDIIKKAFLIEQSWGRQKYGANPLAGKRSSAHYHGRRDERHTMMNREMARMPRIHSPGPLYFTARVVPQAVKGRKAHPPKAEKEWAKKINRKEWLLAVKSALAYAADIESVKNRGHKFDGKVPIIMDDDFEKLEKTKDVYNALKEVGLEEELKRCSKKKVRAGKGKMRGRRYRRKKGPLIIVSGDCPLLLSARNIPGIDVCSVEDLNVSLLAPGGVPGRLIVITKKALKKLEEVFENE